MEKTRSLLKDVFHFAGNASGLLALLIVVFKGGGLVSDINHLGQHDEITDKQLERVEQGGSAALREYIKMSEQYFKMNDERALDQKSRTERLENMLIKFSEVSTDVKVLTTKFDLLKEQLSKGIP